jgi:3'-phosphoadenosine 5'-phosphosulfate sulfotransferase (PAPS reductase)/FAD synthetase
MYIRLKERSLKAVLRDHKPGKVMFISGVRQQESLRRMLIKDGEIQVDGRTIWCAPFFKFSNDDVRQYRDNFHLIESPVRKYLCMSGECLCGAFAKPGELKEIETWFPETGERIRELEKKVRAAGFPWGWEEAPPAWWSAKKHAEKAGQADAFQAEMDSEIQMLCTTCQFKHEAGEVEPIITVKTP